MYQVCWCWKSNPGFVYRYLSEPLQDALDHVAAWSRGFPNLHHWIESVDDPNIRVPIEG